MDHYFYPKFAKLDPTHVDPTHESGQAFESGLAYLDLTPTSTTKTAKPCKLMEFLGWT